MIDYIIVGSGLAGIAFAEKALQRGKSILVFENSSQNSSRVAGGMYNPVVLKRFNAVWDAKGQLEVMNEFYTTVEKRLATTFHFAMPILRKFNSIEEQNNWFAASDRPGLAPFLSTEIVSTKYRNIDSPFGFGEVRHGGYADTGALLTAYHAFLNLNGLLITDTFEHEKLTVGNGVANYASIVARHVVFAEGFAIKSNPYFCDLPLEGTKGELFTIRVRNLDLDCIAKSNVFLIPLGNNLYKAGATYQWDDKTESPTPQGRQTLIEMIRETLDCEFEIVAHKAGIRPTVKDRKPLLGTHPRFANIHILNGMGTRGVMIAPKMAKLLFEYIESGAALPAEIDIKRFSNQRSPS